MAEGPPKELASTIFSRYALVAQSKMRSARDCGVARDTVEILFASGEMGEHAQSPSLFGEGLCEDLRRLRA